MSGKKSSQTTVTAPAPPPEPPSYGQTLQEYINGLPQMLQAQQQYGPGFAESEYQLAQQYAPLYAQLLQGIESGLYPQTAALQEQLAGQAARGINEPLPPEIAQQYASDFNAGIGNNVNAPIGVSTRVTGLINLQKQWQDYYRDLGLSVTGRLPLRTAQTPQSPDVNAGLGNALSYTSGTYGPYANAYANQQLFASLNGGQQGGVAGGGWLGALGGAATGAKVGSIFGPVGTLGGAALGGFLGYGR